MKPTKENCKDIDYNIDSLWIIGPRAKGGKRENTLHGNFAPQVPDHLIRRYTEQGDVVLEPFCGSGTTLYECERLKRNYIGFDINKEILDHINEKMQDCTAIRYFLNNCDSTDGARTSLLISNQLKELGKQSLDFVLSHPPYWDIIKFTHSPSDLSNARSLKDFTDKFIQTMVNAVEFLRIGKHFAVVIGDVYKNGEVLPLGFILMRAIKANIKCKLKGIVIKDMVGNRAKLGLENLWRYRTLQSDTFLFKHEYIFLFRKG